MTAREETIAFSDREKEIIERCALLLGVSYEEACAKLFSDGLASRCKKRLGVKPSSIGRIR